MAVRRLILRDSFGVHRATIADGTVSVDDAAGLPVRIDGAGRTHVGDPPGHTAWTAVSGDTRWVFIDGEVFELEVQREGRRRSAALHDRLTAPMPASVVRVEAAPGQPVRSGDTLIVLEAMKMELPVRAPADGTVKAVHCRPGDLVQPGVVLIEME